MVGAKRVDRFLQRTADGRNLGELGRRQVVEVLVHRGARVDLVHDAVEARHDDRREAEIGVGGRVGEADFDALGLGVRREGNAAGGRAVARGVGEKHGGFIARHQALVGVGRRVGEGVERLRMLDHAADEVEAGFREVGILVSGHHRLAVLPDREVAVHARTVVAEDRLRHEGRRLAIGVGHVVDHVFVDLHVVGGGDQRLEPGAELMLRGGDLVVVLLDDQTHLTHGRQHLGAHVLGRVHRVHREIAALGAHAVAHVAGVVVAVGVRRQLDRVQLEAGVVRRHRKLHVVEDEEFCFGADEHGVADAGRLQVGLGALGDHARVAAIAFAGAGLENVAEYGQRGLGIERIEVGGGRIRHQYHVRLVDGLPAGNRRAVEHQALGPGVLMHLRDVHGEMLHLAARVGEAQVDVLDVLFLDQFEDAGGVRGLAHDDLPLVCFGFLVLD